MKKHLKKIALALSVIILTGAVGIGIYNYQVPKASAAVTQIGSTAVASVVGTGTATTTGFDTTGATLLILTISNPTDCTASSPLSDSNGNTWHLAIQATGNCIYYAYDKSGGPLVVGANHTVSVGNLAYPVIAFSAFSGTLTTSNPLDQTNGTVNFQPGSITPSQNNELLITNYWDGNGGSGYTVDSGFTVIGTKNYLGANNYGGAVASLVQTTATSENPSWTNTGGESSSIASFKPMASGAATPPHAQMIINKAGIATCGNGYSFCRTMTVDHTQAGASDSSNFTVLASTTLASLKTVANGGGVNNTVSFNGQTVPADLVFSTTSDCGTLMSWDFEHYTATTGEIEAWVLLTTLSHTSDTTFYMCYGKSSVSAYQGGSVGAAWSGDLGVYHFPNGTTLGVNDSTSNANNGTNNSATAGVGQIDGGIVSANSGQYALLNTSYTALGNNYTVSGWANLTNTGNYGDVIGDSSTDVFLGHDPSGFAFAKGSNGNQTTSINVVGGWHYFVMTLSSVTGQILYIDGTAVATSAGSTGGANPVSGLYALGGSSGFPGVGTGDEIHIGNAVRSADWITAEYNNQKSGSTMVGFGNEQGGGAGGATGQSIIKNGQVIIN